MSTTHSGNIQNSIILEEHDGYLNAKRTSIVSSPTLFAVVNTTQSSSGQVTVTPNGLITIGQSPNFIGLTTSVISNTINSITTIAPRTDYVGLMSISGNVNVLSNVTLNASNAFIGLTTTTVSNVINSIVTISPRTDYIGLMTVTQGNQPALTAGSAYIGLASVNIGGTLPALTAGSAYVGLASVNIGGTLPALSAGTNYIGLASVNIGNVVNSIVTIAPRTDFIGLMTVTQGNQPALVASSAFIGLTTVVIGTEIVPSTLVNGFVSAASGGLTQFPTNTVRWLTVKAHASNATTCYVGGSSATINNGYPLDPNDSQGFAIDNTNRLYLVGVAQTEVRYIGAN